MDEDQQRAVDLAKSGKSFFLTGAGGTGKSYVIKNIVEALNKDGRDVALTAMKGSKDSSFLGRNRLGKRGGRGNLDETQKGIQSQEELDSGRRTHY